MATVNFNINVTINEMWADALCSMLKHIEENGANGFDPNNRKIIGIYADALNDCNPRFEIDREFKRLSPYDNTKTPVYRVDYIYDAWHE